MGERRQGMARQNIASGKQCLMRCIGKKWERRWRRGNQLRRWQFIPILFMPWLERSLKFCTGRRLRIRPARPRECRDCEHWEALFGRQRRTELTGLREKA